MSATHPGSANVHLNIGTNLGFSRFGALIIDAMEQLFIGLWLITTQLKSDLFLQEKSHEAGTFSEDTGRTFEDG